MNSTSVSTTLSWRAVVRSLKSRPVHAGCLLEIDTMVHDKSTMHRAQATTASATVGASAEPPRNQCAGVAHPGPKPFYRYMMKMRKPRETCAMWYAKCDG